MLGSEFVGFIVIGVVISLAVLGLRTWAPKAAARRVAERGSIVGPALKPSYEESALNRSAVDMQNLANRQLHDDMLAEALKLKLRARSGSLDERIHTLDRATSKVEDALTARPRSYEGTKLSAELHLDRAQLMDGEATVAPLQIAATLFAEAASLRLGVIDNYVGEGWSYLLMTEKDPEWASTYAVKAAAALSAGFARAPQNVWVLRGWGVAIDRYARSVRSDQAQLAALEADYTAALNEHRGGQHDLFDWYRQVRAASRPMWVDVPPIRDVY
ncbi:MAG: hypothetical protein GY720_15570 [bacterium]|nr:hypothetical protein [bacterium]